VRRCTCGRQRCLELFASASAFAERMHRSGIGVEGLKPGEARGITSVMHEVMRNVADTRQIGAQKDVGRLIARSLSAPVLMLNPESVTLSGSLAVPAVRSGIEEEKARWRHVHDDELSLHLLEGVQNKYAAARGAALGVFRGQLYRRFDDQTLDFHRLTLGVDRARVDSWATHSQFQRRPRQVQIQSETGPRRS